MTWPTTVVSGQNFKEMANEQRQGKGSSSREKAYGTVLRSTAKSRIQRAAIMFIMSEYEWLICTDPVLMISGVPMNDAQRKAIEAATDASWQSTRSIGVYVYVFPGDPIIACDVIRCVVGNPFRLIDFTKHIISVDSGGWLSSRKIDDAINPDIFTWRDGLIPKIAQAIHDGERCSNCAGYGGDYWNYICPVCKDGKGRINRYDPIQMAMLADALEEAGCEAVEMLEHLREHERVCKECKDGTRMCGFEDWRDCKGCNGAGKQPRRHYPGCFAVALFLPKPEQYKTKCACCGTLSPDIKLANDEHRRCSDCQDMVPTKRGGWRQLGVYDG